MTPCISYNTLKSACPVDEASALITELSFEGNADLSETKSAGAVRSAKFCNPILNIGLKGRVTALDSMTNGRAGSTVAALLNFTSARLGHDPSDGSILLITPKLTCSTEDNELLMDHSFRHYPFLTA
jgi:hypothetical protein